MMKKQQKDLVSNIENNNIGLVDGIIYVTLTKNNTLVTLTDPTGNVIT